MNSSDHSEKFPLDDEALVEMLRLDHEWALKQIFIKYNFRLFRMPLVVLRDEESAKDIVQEIFLDLWNRRHSSSIAVLSKYLFTAVKFLVLKEIRNGKCQDRHLQLIHQISFVNQTEESIDFLELENSLEKAVTQLPPRCREIFILSRFENLCVFVARHHATKTRSITKNRGMIF